MQATQETWVWSLSQKDPLRGKWQPTQVYLPGESQGQRRLAGYSPEDCRVGPNKHTHSTQNLHLNVINFPSKVLWSSSTHLQLPCPSIHPGFTLCTLLFQFSSVAQSCLTLWTHEPQHARPPCPSPTPGVYSDSCPSSQWCHPAISSSVVPLDNKCVKHSEWYLT